MTREAWDQRRFADFRARLKSPASHLAYRAQFCLLSGEDLKRAREWDLFVRFCETTHLDVDPAEVEMLDPPWPDLRAEVFGHYHYFELAEVLQEDWMKALAQQEQKPLTASPLPLATVWSPLESIIQKKAEKSYAPQATPLWLLLYSERNDLHWPVVKSLIEARTPEVQSHFQNSVFDHLCLFAANESRVRFLLSKKMIVSPRDEE